MLALLPNMFGRPSINNGDDIYGAGLGGGGDDDDIGRNISTDVCVDSAVSSSVILDRSSHDQNSNNVTENNVIDDKNHNNTAALGQSPMRQPDQTPKTMTLVTPLFRPTQKKSTPRDDSANSEGLDISFQSSDLDMSRTMKMYSHFNPGESVMVGGGTPPSSRVSLPLAASHELPVSPSPVRNDGDQTYDRQTGINLQMDSSVLQSMDGSSGGVFVDESGELEISREGSRQQRFPGVSQPQTRHQQMSAVSIREEGDQHQLHVTNNTNANTTCNSDSHEYAAVPSRATK